MQLLIFLAKEKDGISTFTVKDEEYECKGIFTVAGEVGYIFLFSRWKSSLNKNDWFLLEGEEKKDLWTFIKNEFEKKLDVQLCHIYHSAGLRMEPQESTYHKTQKGDY